MKDYTRSEKWRLAMVNALGDEPVEVSQYEHRINLRAPYFVRRTDLRGQVHEIRTHAYACVDGFDDPTDYAVEDLVEQFHAQGYPRP